RGLPNWVGTALEQTGDATRTAVERASDAVPQRVREPAQRAAGAAADHALLPALAGVVSLLELVNDWAVELNDPARVEALARKRGLQIETFTDLRGHDLKVCDRLLTGNTLRWRTA